MIFQQVYIPHKVVLHTFWRYVLIQISSQNHVSDIPFAYTNTNWYNKLTIVYVIVFIEYFMVYQPIKAVSIEDIKAT